MRAHYDQAFRYLNSVRSHRARHAQVREFGIASADLVLDVGSGQAPHPRANVLCDRFVFDNTERECGAGIFVDRPLVVADATAMPFPDKAFDFVFCSHLLEHMVDPKALLDELQRVGRAGYIETPAAVYEKIYGWPFHRWLVSLEAGALHLQAKDRVICDEALHDWFGRRLADPRFWRAVMPRLTSLGLLTRVVWRDRIDYTISGEPVSDEFTGAQSEETAGVEAGRVETPPVATVARRLRSVMERRTRRGSQGGSAQILERMRCPSCREPMTLGERVAECDECGHRLVVLGAGPR